MADREDTPGVRKVKIVRSGTMIFLPDDAWTDLIALEDGWDDGPPMGVLLFADGDDA